MTAAEVNVFLRQFARCLLNLTIAFSMIRVEMLLVPPVMNVFYCPTDSRTADFKSKTKDWAELIVAALRKLSRFRRAAGTCICYRAFSTPTLEIIHYTTGVYVVFILHCHVGWFKPVALEETGLPLNIDKERRDHAPFRKFVLVCMLLGSARSSYVFCSDCSARNEKKNTDLVRCTLVWYDTRIHWVRHMPG